MTTEPSTNYTNYLLKQLACVTLRCRLMTNEAECIETALLGNFITTDCAETWLHEAGLFGLIGLSSEVTFVSTSP